MWIVHLALRRPYTFVVFSVLVMILGTVAAIVTPKDIFPYINIPVVSVVWIYDGLTPEEMANRMVTICERGLTTTVNDIEHLESQSYQGVSVIRVYFQPNVKVELAVAQITSITQTMLRVMPPGTLPPSVIKYDVASVPVLTLGLSGEGLNEQDISDLGRNFIRTRLATVQGASLPLPWGGKARQIMVDLDPNALYAKHLSAGGHGACRKPGICGEDECESFYVGRVEQPSHSRFERCAGLHQGCGASAQRLRGANECGAAEWAAFCLHERVEERASFDAGYCEGG